jgi:hypothetical protein
VITSKKTTNIEEIAKTVRYTFSGDDLLFQKYHLVNTDVEKAIRDTLDKITEEVATNPKYLFFILEDVEKGSVIGYFSGMIYGFMDGHPKTSMLHSFGINVTFRSKESISQLFDLVDHQLGGQSIVCPLYEKNTRAINACVLSGYKVVKSGKDGNEPYVLLKKGKEDAGNNSNCGGGACVGCGRCESAI